MSRKLLYFNLAIDESDTSLGFAINWIETIAENYDQVDVVSLRKLLIRISQNLSTYTVQIKIITNLTSTFIYTKK